MSALAILTHGMVSIPPLALKQCRAAQEGLLKPIGIKPVVKACSTTARISIQPKVVMEPLFPETPKPKPKITAKAKTNGVVKVSVKETAPAPTPDTTQAESKPKPTVKVYKNGNGKSRPKLTVKKKKP